MGYSLESALFQWEDGQARVRAAEGRERDALERAVEAVLEELRRRLGSSFFVEELAGFYGSGLDWAAAIAQQQAPGADATWTVDAAFARYAREAVDFAGGLKRP